MKWTSSLFDQIVRQSSVDIYISKYNQVERFFAFSIWTPLYGILNWAIFDSWVTSPSVIDSHMQHFRTDMKHFICSIRGGVYVCVCASATVPGVYCVSGGQLSGCWGRIRQWSGQAAPDGFLIVLIQQVSMLGSASLPPLMNLVFLSSCLLSLSFNSPLLI